MTDAGPAGPAGVGRQKRWRWNPGDRFGRYTLSARLGAGSFAEVWRATEEGNLGLRREVALKLLKKNDDEDRVSELLHEARLVAGIAHPNVVGVHQVDEDEGVFYIAMDYVDGGTLGTLIAKAVDNGLTIPRSVVTRLGLDIARGLAAAHDAVDHDGQRQPVIHRDLKPANVLVSRAGLAKIADFGLAKVTGAETATATGTLKGTPAYVAPEIWQGGREFVPPVDLFALGCILYEMVRGRRLLNGASMPAIFGQATVGDPADEVRPVAELFPQIAPVIEGLIQRDPSRRTQSAAEVVGDLSQVLREVDVGCDLETFMALIDRLGAPSAEPIGSRSSLRLPATTSARWAAFIEATTGVVVPIDGELVEGLTPQSDRPTQTPLPTLSLTAALPSAPEATNPGPVGPDGPQFDREVRGSSGRGRLVLTICVGVLLLLAVGLTLRSGSEDSGVTAAEVADSRGLPGSGSPRPEEAPPKAEQPVDAPSPKEVAVKVPKERSTPAVAEVRSTPTVAASVDSDPFSEEPPNVDKEDVGEALEESTPSEESAPALLEPAAVEPSPKSCLLLASRPAGGTVWLGGARSAKRAAGTPSRGQLLDPGTHRIGMGLGSSMIDDPVTSW